jgi:hypothetical protein
LSWPHRNATISKSKSRRRTPSLPSRRAPSRARSTTRPARPEEGRAAAVAAAAARGRRAQRSANQGAFAFSNPVACLRAPWRCSSTAFVAFDDSTATVSLSGYAATLQQECDRSAVEQYSCTLVCTAIVRTALYDHLVVEPATSDGLMTSFVIKGTPVVARLIAIRPHPLAISCRAIILPRHASRPPQHHRRRSTRTPRRCVLVILRSRCCELRTGLLRPR